MFSELSTEYEIATTDKIEKVISENEKISDEVIENSLEEYICKRAEIKESEVDVIYKDGEIEHVDLYTKKAPYMQA